MEMTTGKKGAPLLAHLPHPINTEGRELFFAAFYEDETLGEYFARNGAAMPHGDIALWCNDIPVPSANWENLIPYPGDRIVIRTTMQGGGGGGMGKVLRTVAMVAIMVAAAYVTQGASLAYGPAWGAVAGAAVAIGGSLLVNALLPLPTASPNSATNYQSNAQTPTYSLSGGRNSARTYQPLLLCLGYNKVIPDLGSLSYTEFIGQDQYLFQVFNFGLSDITLSNFMIGTTPITSYSDVTIQVSGPDGKLTLVNGDVSSQTVQDLASAAGWIQRTTSINSISIGIDIITSLYYINDTGGVDPRSVTFQIQYCPTGTGAWASFLGGTFTVTGASQTPIRNSYRLDVTQGQYDVRCQKVTTDVATNRESNLLSWGQLRSYQLDQTDYTGQVRVALKIRATAQLSGSIDTFSATAQATCPVWNGTTWVTQATSNPAWWCLWWARGKFYGGRRVYGAGLPDARIDIEGIKAFGAYCDANNLTCNFVQGAATSIATMMDQIALNGDGSATWLTGKLGVVWDAPNQSPVMQFGPYNIKRDTFQIEYNTQSIADEIIVEFVNPAKGWASDQVRAKPPNVTAPNNPVTLNFMGCTSPTLAGRKANLLAAGQYYHRRKVTWSSDLEGFVAQRGDVVVISHDVTQWSYSGRLVDGNRTTLTLDRAVPLSATPGFVSVRFPDGTYQTYGVAGGSGITTTLTLTSPISASIVQSGITIVLPVPSENPDMVPYDWVFFYDPLATPGKLFKIISVVPQSGGDEVQITATDEEPLYYAAASSSFTYAPPRNYTSLNGNVQSITFRELLLNATTGISRVTASWTTGVATGATVLIKINNGSVTTYTVGGNSIDIQAYTNDIITVTVQPTMLVNVTQATPLTTTYTVLGILSALPIPQNLSTVYRDGLTHIIWTTVVDARTINYEMRIGTTWATATLVSVSGVTDLVAIGDGTYWLASRYATAAGGVIYSTPTSIVIAGAALVRNVLVTKEESPGWTGALTGGASVSGVNLICSATVPGTYTFPVGDQVNVGRVVPCQLIIKSAVTGTKSSNNILTMTNIFLNLDILEQALGQFVTVVPQIAVAQASGIFGPWQNFAPGIYSGQYFTSRILMSSIDATVSPVITQYSMTVDMPDRLDTGTNLAVGTGGVTVTFSSAFNGGVDAPTVPHVQITLLNAVANDQVILSAVGLSSFTVQIKNAGAGVARNVNWLAQGY